MVFRFQFEQIKKGGTDQVHDHVPPRAGDHLEPTITSVTILLSMIHANSYRLTRGGVILPKGTNCLGSKWLLVVFGISVDYREAIGDTGGQVAGATILRTF